MVEGRLDRNGSTFGFSLLEMDRCKYALFPFGTETAFYAQRGSAGGRHSGAGGDDPSLYEAAEIDGANGWQKFRYVTLPLLRPTTIYVLTISIYAGLAMFLESYMLWAGNNSPKNIGLTIVGYLYKRGIEKNDMGYACAVGMVLLVIALVINIVQLVCNGTFKREED